MGSNKGAVMDIHPSNRIELFPESSRTVIAAAMANAYKSTLIKEAWEIKLIDTPAHTVCCNCFERPELDRADIEKLMDDAIDAIRKFRDAQSMDSSFVWHDFT